MCSGGAWPVVLAAAMQHALRSVAHARDLRGPLAAAERPALYTHACCPYAQRVLMALLHKASPARTLLLRPWRAHPTGLEHGQAAAPRPAPPPQPPPAPPPPAGRAL